MPIQPSECFVIFVLLLFNAGSGARPNCRHCEKRSDEAIQLLLVWQASWIASLRSQ
jgi:hypothetical protein